MLMDLWERIIHWKDEGEQIIVAGDFNEDVQSPAIKTAPNTFLDGTAPIDGVFGTRNIRRILSGYTDFQWGLKSDHQML